MTPYQSDWLVWDLALLVFANNIFWLVAIGLGLWWWRKQP